jgi:hypothetical protein
MARRLERVENGGCPCCWATDEEDHHPGCELGRAEADLAKCESQKRGLAAAARKGLIASNNVIGLRASLAAIRNVLEVDDDTKTCTVLMLAENMDATVNELRRTLKQAEADLAAMTSENERLTEDRGSSYRAADKLLKERNVAVSQLAALTERAEAAEAVNQMRGDFDLWICNRHTKLIMFKGEGCPLCWLAAYHEALSALLGDVVREQAEQLDAFRDFEERVCERKGQFFCQSVWDDLAENATPQSECERLGYHVCGPARQPEAGGVG